MKNLLNAKLATIETKKGTIVVEITLEKNLEIAEEKIFSINAEININGITSTLYKVSTFSSEENIYIHQRYFCYELFKFIGADDFKAFVHFKDVLEYIEELKNKEFK